MSYSYSSMEYYSERIALCIFIIYESCNDLVLSSELLSNPKLPQLAKIIDEVNPEVRESAAKKHDGITDL
jgi:hypothetical protein